MYFIDASAELLLSKPSRITQTCITLVTLVIKWHSVCNKNKLLGASGAKGIQSKINFHNSPPVMRRSIPSMHSHYCNMHAIWNKPPRVPDSVRAQTNISSHRDLSFSILENPRRAQELAAIRPSGDKNNSLIGKWGLFLTLSTPSFIRWSH